MSPKGKGSTRADLKNVLPVTVYLTPEQHAKLKQAAEELTKLRRERGEIESVSVANIIRKLVDKYTEVVKEHY